MSKRSVVVLFLFVIIGVVGGLLLWERSAPELCEVCARPIHQAMRFTVTTKGLGEKTTCCPRCALRFQGLDPGSIADLRGVDYATGERVDGRQAFYVEGSDVHLCCSVAPQRDIQGNRYDLDWDRCLPSLVTFGSREEAEAFREEHGGRVVIYADLVEEIRRESGTHR